MMIHFPRLRVAGLVAGLLAVVFVVPAIIMIGAVTPVQAQHVTVSVKFRNALDPYGRWVRHDRWGEVWVPAHVKRGWRPYTVGHWVYTDNWGWYWNAADAEADWAWIVYHYGRWVFDSDLGWVWVPGDEWAPAWVEWRNGDSYVGWAPQPPDVIRVDIRDSPRYWVFVQPRHLTDVRVVQYVEPATEHVQILQRTAIVNRTFYADRGSRIAVNPGLPPAYLARVVGRPIQVYNVRPVIVAGTTPIPGAVEFGVGERTWQGRRPQAVVEQSNDVVEASQQVAAPQALGPNEQGRLGSRPPKAAQRGAQPGSASPTQNAQQGQPPQQQGQAAEQQGKQQQAGQAAQRQGEKNEGTVGNQLSEEPSKTRAERQRKGERGNQATEQQKREPSKNQAAEQDKRQPSKSQAAEQEGREPSKSKAADRQDREPKNSAAEQQNRRERSRSESAEQQQGRERGKEQAAEQRQREPKGQPAERQRSRATQEPRPQTEGRSPARMQGPGGGAERSRSELPQATPHAAGRQGGAVQRSTTGAAPQAGRGGPAGRSPAAPQERGRQQD